MPMHASNGVRILGGTLTVGVLLSTSPEAPQVSAQASRAPSQPATETKDPGSRVIDPYDRGAVFYAYQRVGKSGLERGQEVYYMRCWMCHSEYVMATDPLPAPSLRDLFKTKDEKYVEMIVRSGTGRMPSYTRETLTDEQLKDLVAYLKTKCGTYPTGGGCFDEHNPPRNPRYKYGDPASKTQSSSK
jgi:hypothetical protein